MILNLLKFTKNEKALLVFSGIIILVVVLLSANLVTKIYENPLESGSTSDNEGKIINYEFGKLEKGIAYVNLQSDGNYSIVVDILISGYVGNNYLEKFENNITVVPEENILLISLLESTVTRVELYTSEVLSYETYIELFELNPEYSSLEVQYSQYFQNFSDLLVGFDFDFKFIPETKEYFQALLNPLVFIFLLYFTFSSYLGFKFKYFNEENIKNDPVYIKITYLIFSIFFITFLISVITQEFTPMQFILYFMALFIFSFIVLLQMGFQAFYTNSISYLIQFGLFVFFITYYGSIFGYLFFSNNDQFIVIWVIVGVILTIISICFLMENFKSEKGTLQIKISKKIFPPMSVFFSSYNSTILLLMMLFIRLLRQNNVLVG